MAATVTADVVTVKDDELEPAARPTEAGVLIADVLSASATVAPPPPVAAVVETVPVEFTPPLTALGFMTSEDRTGWGCKVSVAVFLICPPWIAVTFLIATAETGDVEMLNWTDVYPDGIEIVAGVPIAVELSVIATLWLMGHAAFRNTLPSTPLPPITLLGVRVNEVIRPGRRVSELVIPVVSPSTTARICLVADAVTGVVVPRKVAVVEPL